MAAKAAPAPMPPAFIDDAAPLNEATVVLAAPPDGLAAPEVALAKPLDGCPVVVAYGAVATSALMTLTKSFPTLLK